MCRESLVVLVTQVTRQGSPHIGVAVLDAARAAGMPMTERVHNTALQCYAASGNAAALDREWRTMIESGIPIGAEAHAARLQVLWRTRGSAVGYSYLQDLVVHEPGQLSRSAFEIALRYAQQDPAVTYDVLRWILGAMHAHGIRSWVAEASFYQGCENCELTPAEVEECVQLLATTQQRNGRRPYRRQVFHLLQACRKSKCSQRAADIWQLCKSMNVEMHSGIAGAMLRCCEQRKGEEDMGKLAAEVADWLKETWLRLSQIDKASAAMRQANDNMRTTFDLLIQYYAACMRFQEGMATVKVLLLSSTAFLSESVPVMSRFLVLSSTAGFSAEFSWQRGRTGSRRGGCSSRRSTGRGRHCDRRTTTGARQQAHDI
jgi:hypothetical protein